MYYILAFLGGALAGVVLDEFFAGSVKNEIVKLHQKVDAVLAAIKK